MPEILQRTKEESLLNYHRLWFFWWSEVREVSKIVKGEELRGGVAVLFKHAIWNEVHSVKLEHDQVWFKLMSCPDFLYGAVYIPPPDLSWMPTICPAILVCPTVLQSAACVIMSHSHLYVPACPLSPVVSHMPRYVMLCPAIPCIYQCILQFPACPVLQSSASPDMSQVPHYVQVCPAIPAMSHHVPLSPTIPSKSHYVQQSLDIPNEAFVWDLCKRGLFFK